MLDDEGIEISEDVETRDRVSGVVDEVNGDYTVGSTDRKKRVAMKMTSPSIMMRCVSCVLVDSRLY